jgi:hypothetical protein
VQLPLPQLALLLSLALPFLPRLLLGKMVADDAAGCGAEDRMMARDMTRHGAYCGTFETALRLGAIRCAEQEERGHRRRKPLFRQSRDHLGFLVS